MDRNNNTNQTFDGSSEEKNQAFEDVSFWIIFGVIGCVAFFGNISVILLISTRRRLQTTCNSFILSLSISDFLVAMTTIPGSFICAYGILCNSKVFGIVCNFFLCASVGNVCTMAADRFCRVVYPLRYPVLMCSKNAVLLVALGWLLPFILQFIPSLVLLLYTSDAQTEVNWIFGFIQIFSFAILPSLGLLAAYFRMCRITIKHVHLQRIQVAQLSCNANASQLRTKTRIRNPLSIHVLGAVIFLFVFSWSFTIYRGICDLFTACHVKFPAVMASRLLLVANTAADPIFYAILKRDIRVELVALMRPVFRLCNLVQGLRTWTSGAQGTHS